MDYACVWEIRGQVYLGLLPSASAASEELRKLERELNERVSHAFKMPATPALRRMVANRQRAKSPLILMYEPFERVKASLLKGASE